MHQVIDTAMVKATCRDYGYDCDYSVEGDIDKVAEEFGKHTTMYMESNIQKKH